jgi:hypothetical protein
VASSACEATQLREDCLEFGKVVQMMEGILLKAEGLEDQAPVIDEVREALEEALRLLEAMRERGALQVFWPDADPGVPGGFGGRASRHGELSDHPHGEFHADAKRDGVEEDAE